MFGLTSITTTLGYLALAASVLAHGTINQIKGANGVVAAGFGVSAQNPTRAQVQVLGNPKGCGNLNVANELNQAIASKQVPTTAADGSISLNWFQLNAGNDGGGPGTAFIDTTGTGNNFQKMTITKNFADGGANSNNPMTIQVAAGTVCKGGSNGATCLVRIQNPAGPFGGCFALATSGSGQASSAQKPANQPAPAQASVPASTPPKANGSSTQKTGTQNQGQGQGQQGSAQGAKGGAQGHHRHHHHKSGSKRHHKHHHKGNKKQQAGQAGKATNAGQEECG